MYEFFTPNEEDLLETIKISLDGKDCLKQAKVIQTGWTNITMDVTGEAHDYIFRFPRNSFFAKMMIKDCTFCQFLKGKVSVQTPDMKLGMSKNRPFSMHKKIKGVSLTEKMDKLNPKEQQRVSEDLSVFLSELHTLPVVSMPPQIVESLDGFLTGLASVHQGDYDLTKHNALKSMEQGCERKVIVHGDFNPGNILLDENGHVSGIIDFAFASISDKHADLGRFVGRSQRALGESLIDAYQNRTKTPCSQDKIQKIVDLFKYVECKYVHYMQTSHPEIIIPHSVLQMVEAETKREKTSLR